MAEAEGKKEEKFDFITEGEAVGYISLEQARVQAIRHARDNTEFYGPTYSGTSLVWEVISQDEGEDYYDIKLSFRPAGRFRGEPGVEQFIIDKMGNIDIRQVLDLPMPRRGFPIVPAAIGLAVVVVVAVAVVFVTGSGDDGGETLAAPGQTGTPVPPTAALAPSPTTAAAFIPPVEPKPTAALTPIPTPTAGDLRWRYLTGGSVFSSPAVADGVVYVGSDDGYVYTVDASSGDLRWRYETKGGVFSSPAVAGGVVYVGSRDGYVYAITIA